MKKSTIIIASILCVVGLLVSACGVMAIGFDFSKLNTEKYNERIYDVNEDFENIVMETDVTDVHLLISDRADTYVKSYEIANGNLSVYVKNGTLYIRETEREWYQNIDFSFGNEERFEIYLDRDTYKTLNVDTDTGDVNIPGGFVFDEIDIETDTGNVGVWANAKNISISSDTGDISVAYIDATAIALETDTGKIKTWDVNVKDRFNIETDTGDVFLSHTELEGKLSAITETGDVNFSLSDAGSIYVRTSTGDVRGTLLSQKVFTTYTATGKVRVPNSNSGGSCEIKTSTGDINIKIENY